MAEVLIRAPRAEDAATLAARMRPADVVECHALGHDDPDACVSRAIAISLWAHTALVDGELACVFGVAPRAGRLLADVGIPWLLGTPTLTRHRGAFMRRSPEYIAAMLRIYPRLENVVHEGNTASKAWLQRMGFVLSSAEVMGPRGERFHRFSMEA